MNLLPVLPQSPAALHYTSITQLADKLPNRLQHVLDQFLPDERDQLLAELANLPHLNLTRLAAMIKEYQALCLKYRQVHPEVNDKPEGWQLTPQILEMMLANLKRGATKLKECRFNEPNQILMQISPAPNLTRINSRLYNFKGFPFKRKIYCYSTHQSALKKLLQQIHKFSPQQQQLAFNWLYYLDNDQIIELANFLIKLGHSLNIHQHTTLRLNFEQFLKILLNQVQFKARPQLKQAITARVKYDPSAALYTQQKISLTKGQPANFTSLIISYSLNETLRLRKLEVKPEDETLVKALFRTIADYTELQRAKIYQRLDQLADEEIYLVTQLFDRKHLRLQPLLTLNELLIEYKLDFSSTQLLEFIDSSTVSNHLQQAKLVKDTLNEHKQIFTLSYKVNSELVERKLLISKSCHLAAKQLLTNLKHYSNIERGEIYRWIDESSLYRLVSFFNFVHELSTNLSLQSQIEEIKQVPPDYQKISYPQFWQLIELFLAKHHYPWLKLSLTELPNKVRPTSTNKVLHSRSKLEPMSTKKDVALCEEEYAVGEIVYKKQHLEQPSSNKLELAKFLSHAPVNLTVVNQDILNINSAIHYYSEVANLIKIIITPSFKEITEAFVPYLNPTEVIVSYHHEFAYAITRDLECTTTGYNQLLATMAIDGKLTLEELSRILICSLNAQPSENRTSLLHLHVLAWLMTVKQNNTRLIYTMLLNDETFGFAQATLGVFAAYLAEDKIFLHHSISGVNLDHDWLATKLNTPIVASSLLDNSITPIPRSCANYLNLILASTMVKHNRIIKLPEFAQLLEEEYTTIATQPETLTRIFNPKATAIALQLPNHLVQTYLTQGMPAFNQQLQKHITQLFQATEETGELSAANLIPEKFFAVMQAKIQLIIKTIVYYYPHLLV